jgi:hypothetical protein
MIDLERSEKNDVAFWDRRARMLIDFARNGN